MRNNNCFEAISARGFTKIFEEIKYNRGQQNVDSDLLQIGSHEDIRYK